MPLPADYLAALDALSGAFAVYHARTGQRAVLVGGAATAIYTAGTFTSADFDVVATDGAAFEAALLDQGFRREDAPGHRLGGFFHPDHPDYGFEQVSGRLFDGLADPNRLVVVPTARGEVALPAIEDMIADRLGQYAAGPPSDTSRLLQAQRLAKMAERLDMDYLSRRVRDEQGDLTLLDLGPG